MINNWALSWFKWIKVFFLYQNYQWFLLVVIGITESFYFECSYKRLISTHTFDFPTDTLLAGTYIERIKLMTSITKKKESRRNLTNLFEFKWRCDAMRCVYKIYISIIKLESLIKKKPDSILSTCWPYVFWPLIVSFIQIYLNVKSQERTHTTEKKNQNNQKDLPPEW